MSSRESIAEPGSRGSGEEVGPDKGNAKKRLTSVTYFKVFGVELASSYLFGDLLMTFRILTGLGLGLLAVSAVQAKEQYFSYKDWNVEIQSFDTGEDFRINCTMWTGGDGLPTVGFATSNSDALPPDFFPGVQLTERAVRGHATVLQNDQKVNFVFDDGDSAQATVQAYFDEDGFAVAQTYFPIEDAQRVLQAMQRNGQIDIVGPSGLIYSASLSGFTASYRKVAEGCGFPVTGVID